MTSEGCLNISRNHIPKPRDLPSGSSTPTSSMSPTEVSALNNEWEIRRRRPFTQNCYFIVTPVHEPLALWRRAVLMSWRKLEDGWFLTPSVLYLGFHPSESAVEEELLFYFRASSWAEWTGESWETAGAWHLQECMATLRTVHWRRTVILLSAHEPWALWRCAVGINELEKVGKCLVTPSGVYVQAFRIARWRRTVMHIVAPVHEPSRQVERCLVLDTHTSDWSAGPGSGGRCVVFHSRLKTEKKRSV